MYALDRAVPFGHCLAGLGEHEVLSLGRHGFQFDHWAGWPPPKVKGLAMVPTAGALAMARPPFVLCRRMLVSFHPIAILRGWACLALGRVRVSTPSSRLALIFSLSTVFDSVNERA